MRYAIDKRGARLLKFIKRSCGGEDYERKEATTD